MMSIRRQPFGYQIYSGRITVNDSEADIVKYIFRAYIGGASFNHIKLSLLNQPVSYDGDKAWNKNMIARILGDRRYVGTDVYPPILPRNEFEAAESIRTSKVQTDTRTEAQRLLYKLSDKRPAVQAEADVLGIINVLIYNPSLIKEQETVPEITETLKLQQMLKIQEMLQQQPLPPAETQIELSKAAHLAHLIEPFKEMETPVVWRNTENDKIRIKHWLEAEVEDDFFDVGKLKKSVLNLPYQEAKYNGT